MDVRNNQLWLGGIAVEELMQRFGSPLYVYDEKVIKTQIECLRLGFTQLRQQNRFQIHYAMKANSNPKILQLLHCLGIGIDAVSPWEVRLALEAGFAPDQILFTGNNIGLSELTYCLEKNVVINIGSLCGLEQFGERNPGATVSVRVNPGIGAGHHAHCITGGPRSKFGIYYDQLPSAFTLAEKYRLKINGVQSHIGTGIYDPEPMLVAMEQILTIAEPFPDLEFIDFGGGFGIPYRPEQAPLAIESLGQQMTEKFEQFCLNYGSPLNMKIEPGRFVIGSAGYLLVTVTDRKETPEYTFIGTDSGFNHLIRPTLYGSYHRIFNASSMEGKAETVAVVGNICENGDFFTVNGEEDVQRSLPIPKIGNRLILADVGAYGFVMASQYNSRPRPAEILLSNGTAQLIRRADSYEDLLRNCV